VTTLQLIHRGSKDRQRKANPKPFPVLQEVHSAYIDFDPSGVTLVTTLAGLVFVIEKQPIRLQFGTYSVKKQ
jgi:hypothetical protein